MVPQGTNRENNKRDMEMVEELVERTPEDGHGLEEYRNEGDNSLERSACNQSSRASSKLTINPVVDSPPDLMEVARAAHPPLKLTTLMKKLNIL